MSSDYAHKLQTFEARPPEGAWNRIAEVLDESAAPRVGDKLFFYEQAPPRGTWEKIEAALPAGKGKVIPLSERFRRPIRYASATAALVVIGLLTSLLLSKRTESGPTAATNPVEKAGNAITATPNSPARPEGSAGSPEPSISSNENDPPRTIAYRDARTAVSTARLSYLNTTDVTEGLRKAVRSSMLFRRLFSVPDEPRAIPAMDGADRYMVFSDGNGHLARLPKSMYEDVRCKEDDLACQQRIRSLQQKISASAFTTDFTGVMQILGNLQENN